MKEIKLDKKQVKELLNVLKEIKVLSGKYYKTNPQEFKVLLGPTDDNTLSLLHYGKYIVCDGLDISYRLKYGEGTRQFYEINFNKLFDIVKDSEWLMLAFTTKPDIVTNQHGVVINNGIINLLLQSNIINYTENLIPNELILLDKPFIETLDLHYKITRMVDDPLNRPAMVNVRVSNENNRNYYVCTETRILLEQKAICSVMQNPFEPININPTFIKSLLKLSSLCSHDKSKQNVRQINIYKEKTYVDLLKDQTVLKYEIIGNNLSILVGQVENNYPQYKNIFPTDTKKAIVNTQHIKEFVEKLSKAKKVLYEKDDVVKFKITIKNNEITFTNRYDDENIDKQIISSTYNVVSIDEGLEYEAMFNIDFFELIVDYLDSTVTELHVTDSPNRPITIINSDKRILLMPIITSY